MDLQRRNFALLLTVAAAVVTPALGQSGAPAVRAAIGASDGAESIPDSGIVGSMADADRAESLP